MMKLRIHEKQIFKVAPRQNTCEPALWYPGFAVGRITRMENIINKCAEQTGKSCIFSPLSEFYSFSSFQKNLIICFLCKHFFMNLGHYLSISLLRDEV